MQDGGDIEQTYLKKNNPRTQGDNVCRYFYCAYMYSYTALIRYIQSSKFIFRLDIPLLNGKLRDRRKSNTVGIARPAPLHRCGNQCGMAPNCMYVSVCYCKNSLCSAKRKPSVFAPIQNRGNVGGGGGGGGERC
jgi:hypothetical protein